MKKKKKRRLKKKFRIIKKVTTLIIILVVAFFGKLTYDNYQYEQEQIRIREEQERLRQEKIAKQKKDYEDCLAREYSEEDKTEFLIEKENEFTKYIKSKYNLSVKMYDKNTKYTYSYDEDRVYYAASTIKMLDAIYIYQKATKNELSLDSGVVYQAKFKAAYSYGMQKRKIGEKVSLRDLVKYAVTVSDNTAHQMLVNYIGFNELKKFGNSLGAKNTLIGGDNFGNISAKDSIIYIKALDELIDSSPELGEELKSYFINSDQNYLKIESEGIDAAQKYGCYSYFYHSNGIVYANNIYYISILTVEGESKSKQIAEDINLKAYNLQKTFYENRQNVCHTEVYGTEEESE